MLHAMTIMLIGLGTAVSFLAGCLTGYGIGVLHLGNKIQSLVDRIGA